uniref:Uncharacterized protein n=1 Tax=Oryza punctata TaxID=4537 RepID=A0A0E0MLE9_ORYPU
MSCVLPLYHAILLRDPLSFVLTLKHVCSSSTNKVDKIMEEMKPIIVLSLLGGVSNDSVGPYSTNRTLKQVNRQSHTRVIPPQLLPKDQKITSQKPS